MNAVLKSIVFMTTLDNIACNSLQLFQESGKLRHLDSFNFYKPFPYFVTKQTWNIFVIIYILKIVGAGVNPYRVDVLNTTGSGV
jgi:hypothetical protein